MANSDMEKEEEQIESHVQNLKLEGAAEVKEEANGTSRVKAERNADTYDSLTPALGAFLVKKTKSSTQSPIKSPSTPSEMMESTVGGEISVKQEPGQAPKLARTASQKIVSRPPPLYIDEPDKYEEATKTFEVITECNYATKWLGETEHAMECDCRESWVDGKNHACDEESDCINRLTKIECTGQGTCGKRCQNRRFKNKDYANVSVFKTEKKGYGLRANEPLESGDFIFEYIGDVIDEPRFRKRMLRYDDEGIKHFYFMSLNKGEFIDATKKGNLGRFCNHSCNPNCFVDKWVVGDKLCMGIFAGRSIKPGEELVFNYNVDRYGANPQPCYCGEPNCTGYIGGKTQTERATKLSDATIEALGIEDGDSWDTAVSRRPKKAKKTGENDEEYVNNVKPKSLEEDGVTNLMATLMQCKEKWIAVKLLNRIQRAEDEKVIYRIVRMHGYRTLKITLNEFFEDSNVCLQVLEILERFPRLSRNKIENSGIEVVINKLTTNEDELVAEKSQFILDEWAKLTVEYRIPRMKRDPNEQAEPVRDERRDRRPRSKSPPKTRSVSPPHAPAGPRGNTAQRANFFGGPRPPFRRAPPPPPGQLPPGWFAANDAAGKTYYYSGTGATQWTRPTAPANQAQPPPPPKTQTNEERLQQIINDCLNVGSTPATQATSVTTTPAPTGDKPKAKKEEKWRSYPLEKQKKVYENTLFPHIKPIVDKFKNKLPRDDLKRHAKEITKKMVESDYKNHRVTDPTKISSKQVKAIKKYVVEFFNKAVKKRREHEKQKREKVEAARQASEKAGSTTPPALTIGSPKAAKAEDEEDVQLSEDEGNVSDDENDNGKRKRESETPATPLDGEESAAKKVRMATPPPPPPPPPPPAEADPEAEDEDVGMDGSATPTQEISSLNADAWAANGGVKQEPSPSDTNEGASMEFSLEGSGTTGTNGHGNANGSPMQLATPSTNGTYEQDLKLKGQKVLAAGGQ